MTPFDLPALSPVPQKAEQRVPDKYNMGDTIKKDRVMARSVNLSASSSEEGSYNQEKRRGGKTGDGGGRRKVEEREEEDFEIKKSMSGAELFASSRGGSVRRVAENRGGSSVPSCEASPRRDGQSLGLGQGQESRKSHDKTKENKKEEEGDVTEISVEAKIVVQTNDAARRIGNNVWTMEEQKTEEKDYRKEAVFQEELDSLGIRKPTVSASTSTSSSSSSYLTPCAPYSSSYPQPTPSSASSSSYSPVSTCSSSCTPPKNMTYILSPACTSQMSNTLQKREAAQMSQCELKSDTTNQTSCQQSSQVQQRSSNLQETSSLEKSSEFEETLRIQETSQLQQTFHVQESSQMQEMFQMTETSETSQNTSKAMETSQSMETSQMTETSQTMQTSNVQETYVSSVKQHTVHFEETSLINQNISDTTQIQPKINETSETRSSKLSERFAEDSTKRYEAAQNLLKIAREDKNEGCIEGRHKDVITECIEELELSTTANTQDMEKVIDMGDLEHLDRQSHNNLQSCSTSSSCPLLESPSTTSCITEDEDTTAKETETETEDEDTLAEKEQESRSETGAGVFLTEFATSEQKENDTSYTFVCSLDDEKRKKNRRRRRTIDYHDLKSTLMYECSVRDYHEKKYGETQVETTQAVTETNDNTATSDDRVEIAKDGLGLILQRLHNIESKLDDLKNMETSVLGQDVCPPSRRYSLPGRLGSISPSKPLHLLRGKDEREIRGKEKEGGPDVHGAHMEDGANSNCSTPTMMEPRVMARVNGYESDETQVPDSDCDGFIDDKSEEENNGEFSYRRFPMEFNIEEMSEEEDPEERQKRIESLASSITIPDHPRGFQRPEMNMEIDTLSERSEEESEKEEASRPRVRSRRPSGKKRSMSRERNVAKIRYCWRCHHAGHENWQCQEDVQPGGWCPRCLESTHWEDACWVEAAHVLCPICSIPGHLPCVHQATDFRQRKLVIDTFGWLAFREWFQDMTFRSWWNCSGFTGVPLYKIMQRNPSQDLDLGFDDQ